MKNVLRQIIRSGVSNTDDHLTVRGIVLSNYISLILCTALVMLFALRWLMNGYVLYYAGVGIALFALPVIFNRLYWTTLSRLYLCYVPVIFLWLTFVSIFPQIESPENSIYDSVRMFLLAISPIPYLLFEKEKNSVLLAGILPTLLSILLFEIILRWLGVSSRQLNILTNDYQLMQGRAVVCYLIISASCYAFLYVIRQNDKVNHELMADLKNKTEEIEMQNEELIMSQEMLKQLNLHLEEIVADKTRSIEKQNEQLTKYAHSNAHHVRGPIARLLGLIQLSKMETEINYPWYFDKIEQEAVDIDSITKRIARELNGRGASMFGITALTQKLEQDELNDSRIHKPDQPIKS